MANVPLDAVVPRKEPVYSQNGINDSSLREQQMSLNNTHQGRVEPSADDCNRAVELVKYAEHNGEFSSDPLVRAAREREAGQRSAMDYLLLSTEEWKDGNYEKSLRNAYTGIAVGTANKRIMACLELRIGTVFQDLGSEDRSWELAGECFDTAMEMDPKFPLPYVFAGDLQFDQDEFDEAEALYKKAKQLDKKDPSSYNSLGYLYLEQERMEEAEEEFKKAEKLEPDLPIVHLHLAQVFQDQGRPDEAAQQFRKAIARYPENPMYYNYLAQLLMELEQPDEARKVVEKALTFAPENEALLDTQRILQKK